jgi:MFS family permease
MISVRLLLSSGGSLFSLLLAQALQGLTFMTCYYCGVIYIRENVTPGRDSQGQSILVLVQMGLASCLGNLIGGRIMQAVGFQLGFRVMAGFILIAALILCAAYRRHVRTSIPPAV